MSLSNERRVVKEDTNDGFIEEYSVIPTWKVKKSVKKVLDEIEKVDENIFNCGCSMKKMIKQIIKEEFSKELI